MSGFLEALKAQTDQNTATIAELVAAVQALRATPAATPAPASNVLAIGTPAPALANTGLGGLNLGAPAPAQVATQYPDATGPQIVEFITPYVENQQIKEALGVEMRAMGINALPEAQPHQYGELLHRFRQVIARFQQQQANAPVAATPSLI